MVEGVPAAAVEEVEGQKRKILRHCVPQDDRAEETPSVACGDSSPKEGAKVPLSRLPLPPSLREGDHEVVEGVALASLSEGGGPRSGGRS